MTRRHPSFVFEVTRGCNHRCPHCYNVWTRPAPYPGGELGTAETLAMLGRLLDETGATLVSLTGGEPLLRADLPEIVTWLAGRGITVNLICNGTLLDEAAIDRLDGVRLFELPLLSVESAIHDELSGMAGAFDRVTMAMAELKARGKRVIGVFVATRRNLASFGETVELAFALGLDGLMLNRFNPGGRGFENVEALQPDPDEMSAALDAAQALSTDLDFPIACSIPMPPCLFDHARWPRLSFGFCAAGTERAYYTVDPMGNLRPCNHSPTILGNLREQAFWDIVDGEPHARFVAARPAFCSGCAVEEQCKGGCKAAAESCYGCIDEPDPLLRAFSGRARRV